MNSTETFYLNIADFSLKLIIPAGSDVVLDHGFTHFMGTETEHPDISIHCFESTKLAPKIWGKQLYSAKDGDLALWRIFEVPNGICLHVFDSEQLDRLQHIAFYHTQQQTWEIYTNRQAHGSLEPLRYPMMPLILYYLTTHSQAFFIHGSGIFDGEKGRVFSGFSGVGKSTMAGLWEKNGATVINDDRLMLRFQDGRWWMHNTPMYYVDERKKAPLDFIYLPYHHSENFVDPTTGTAITMRFLAHCVQHGYNSGQVQWHLDQVFALAKHIPIQRLGVVPTPEVLTYIQANEAK